MKRTIGILFGAALALAPISAMAADQTSSGPLAPGAAAGVQKAENWGWQQNQTAYLLGGAAIIAAVVIIASDDNGHHSSSTSATLGTH